MPNQLVQFMLFIATVAVLFAIWVWFNADLGNWAFPVALGVPSISLIIGWLLRDRSAAAGLSDSPKFAWRRPAALDPRGHPIIFVAFVMVTLTLAGKLLGWI